MKRKNIAACILGITAICLGTKADAQSVIFDNPLATSNTGNQSGFDLGMGFTVNSPVTVTALGTFDGNIASYPGPATQAEIATSLGPTYYSSDDPINIQVAIYNATTGNIVSTIALFNYAGATNGQYYAKNSDIFQNISPLTLAPGNYEIVSTGYTFLYESGNTSPTVSVPPSPTPTFNTLGGALTLTTNGAAFNGVQENNGYLPLSFPTGTTGVAELNGSPDFEGPTFIASTSVPDGGMTVGLLGFALLGAETLRRKLKR